MQEGTNARQQVVERIRQSTSILVAVGNNPSVDALAASLGLTLMLNKLNKHTTAVFSGVIPQAIQFLEPNKSFESNVDALRDFIISLDKEKADRLRYKVEDDVVRIFITPYKTSISQADLQFSQGDFNVDLIIALGVEKREDLDKAIVAHGRILHDATVITVNADNQRSSLGSIDWQDSAASSLCEMLVGASEAFQQPGILDAQISTALLTGIVANTDRFSNPRTSPRVMTMAAQLMAAGANQQLIATNLEKAKEIAAPAAAPVAGPMAKQQASPTPAPMPEEPAKPKKEPGELDIVHEKDQPKPAPAPVAAPAPALAEPTLTDKQEKELEAALPQAQVQHNLLPEVKDDLLAATAAVEEEPAIGAKAPGGKSVNDAPVVNEAKKEEDGEGDYISSHGSWKGKRLEPPTLGGTLNATTEEAHDASAKAEDADRNKKLLTHPDDAQPMQKSKRNRGKKGKGGSGNLNQNDGQNQAAPVASAAMATPAATPALPAEPVVAPLPPAPTPVEQAPVVNAPVMPPQPTVAPLPEPEPVAPPAPQPAMPPMPELPPTPAPLPPAPMPEAMPEPAPAAPPVTAPTPEPTPVPTPPAPVAPELPPMPEPAPAPMPAAPAPNPEEVHKEVADSAAEAAAAAQPAQSVVGDLDSAREAVSAALDAQPFNPAGQPAESVGAQPMAAMPDMPISEPLSPAALQQLPPAPESVTPPVGDLPPMPPMPPLPQSGAELPPAPDLPGLNAPLPPISEAPAPAPEQPPAAPPSNDPKQFKIPGQ